MQDQVLTVVCNAYFAIFVVAAFILAKGIVWLKEKGKIVLPEGAAEWLKKLSWSSLVAIYYEAEEASTVGDTKRDFYVDALQKLVRDRFGKEISDHIANFICEYVVAIMKRK